MTESWRRIPLKAWMVSVALLAARTPVSLADYARRHAQLGVRYEF